MPEHFKPPSLLSNSLTVLADRIKVAVATSVTAEKTAIESALDAGHLLCEAKDVCHHGEWLPFLDRAGIPERKAQRLMRLGRSGLNSDTVSDLGGIKASLRWLEGFCLPGIDELLLVSLNGFTSTSERWAAVWPDNDGHKFAIFDADSVNELAKPIVKAEYVVPALISALDNRHGEMSFRLVEHHLEFPSFEGWLRELLGEEKATEFATKVTAAEAEVTALHPAAGVSK